MPQSMFVFPGDRRDRGHNSSCRESSAQSVNTYIDASTSITTEMNWNRNLDPCVPVLQSLLNQLSDYFPGVSAQVSTSAAAGWTSKLIVVITWTDATLAAHYWWWATLLQRIVLDTNPAAYDRFTDITMTLNSSSSVTGNQYTSTKMRTNHIRLWSEIVKGEFTTRELSEKMVDTSRGPLTARDYVLQNRRSGQENGGADSSSASGVPYCREDNQSRA